LLSVNTRPSGRTPTTPATSAAPVAQATRIDNFSWWHNFFLFHIFAIIFYSKIIKMPLRMGPTCHRDNHQNTTFFIPFSHPPLLLHQHQFCSSNQHLFYQRSSANNGRRRGLPSRTHMGSIGPTTRPTGLPPRPYKNSRSPHTPHSLTSLENHILKQYRAATRERD
jgi:hypothetical protein